MTEDNGIERQTKTLNRFIAKTYRIINSDDVPTACWFPGGKSFLILDPKKFSQTVLPKYFKHSKFTSFVRQLNFYGFHKIRIDPNILIANENTDNNNSDNETAKKYGDMVCFQHKFFQAGQPKLLQKIQRTTKQVVPTAVAESQSLSQQKEIESLQKQMEDMKKHIDSTREEFDVKLAAARAELELDYLHRIRTIEVSYKDLVLMILSTKESSDFPLPGRNRSRHFPGPMVRGAFHPESRSSILLGQTYTSRDYLVKHKLDLLSPLDHSNGGRRSAFADAGTKSNKLNIDAMVGASLERLQKREKTLFGNKINDATSSGVSPIELLRKEKQNLPTFAIKRE